MKKTTRSARMNGRFVPKFSQDLLYRIVPLPHDPIPARSLEFMDRLDEFSRGHGNTTFPGKILHRIRLKGKLHPDTISRAIADGMIQPL